MIIMGIATCDTCRKARAQLGQRASWRDIRKDPLSPDEVGEILATFGDRAVNRSSATWRQLGDAERAHPLQDLLLAHPTLLKRPLIRDGAKLYIGWTAEVQGKVMEEAGLADPERPAGQRDAYPLRRHRLRGPEHPKTRR